ncbi:MAG: recombinase family protein [Solirubrobacteraceae bacterium]
MDALRRAGVVAKDIYVDNASGAKASRPQLDTVLGILRDGDTLKITRLDRLGRSVLHLVTLGAELREQGQAPSHPSQTEEPRQRISQLRHPPPSAGLKRNGGW